MELLIGALINSLSSAAIFALIAFGYHLTFITTDTLNFSQGEFVMLGGLIGVMLSTSWQNDGALSGSARPLWNYWVVFLISIIIMTCAGVLLERFVMRPFGSGSTSIGWIMSTVALTFVIQNIAETLYGKDKQPLAPMVDGSIEIAGQAFDWQKIVNIGIVALVIAGLQYFFTRTMLGKSLRAVAFNPAAASLMGINVNYVRMVAFGIAGGLTGIAGFVLAPRAIGGGVSPSEPALVFGILAFAVAIIGGLDNLKGIAFAALLYSFASQLVQQYISNDLSRAITFVLLIIILAVKPTGLFGRTLVQKV